MSRRWILLAYLSNLVRQFPVDLSAVLGLTMATILSVLLPGIRDTSLRILFGLPFTLFLPGYAFIAALFPEASSSLKSNRNRDAERQIANKIRIADLFPGDRGINTIERVALSFGLSIAIVSLFGLMLNFTPWGIRLLPIIVSISIFIIVCTIVAAVRRQKLPEKDRVVVSYTSWLASLRTTLFRPTDYIDAMLNIIFILGLLLAITSIGYAAMTPGNNSPFSEFYLLTEDEDGELVADGYPSEFIQDEGQSLIVGINNQEHETVNYTVIVQLQQVEVENNEMIVLERQELYRFQTQLDHKETRHYKHEITPSISGEDLRLTYLLYKEEPPDKPTQKTSYQDLHLWIDVIDNSEIETQEPIDSETTGDNETRTETEEEENNDSGIEIQEPIDG